jgi:hypothetical protein
VNISKDTTKEKYPLLIIGFSNRRRVKKPGEPG